MTKPKNIFDPDQHLEKVDLSLYTSDYKEACFLIWYKNGPPGDSIILSAAGIFKIDIGERA
jgi:hypothetical protein